MNLIFAIMTAFYPYPHPTCCAIPTPQVNFPTAPALPRPVATMR